MSRKDEAMQIDADMMNASQELRVAVEGMRTAVNQTDPNESPEIWVAWIRLVTSLTHHLLTLQMFTRFVTNNAELKDESDQGI